MFTLESLGPRNLESKIVVYLNGLYFWMQDWIVTRRSVSKIGWNITLSWDQRDLIGK